MSNQQIATQQQQSVKQFFSQEIIKNKIQEVLGKRSNQFITTVLQIASSNDLLAKADPVSILNASMVAATLDLPINQNLGFAYIIPFNQKQKDGSYKTVAQFQLGYKGFIQLAQRSGQFKTISATPIHDGQLIESNPLTGFKFDFGSKKSSHRYLDLMFLIVQHPQLFGTHLTLAKCVLVPYQLLPPHGHHK